MQMLLFFLLGLLSFPSQLPEVALVSLCIAVFLTFIARPIAVFSILSPFQSDLRQKLLVSWSGLRGAASIVFSTIVVTHPAIKNNDIFHIVFFIVLFSLLLQGTFLPFLAKKLDMTDNDSDVMKTFNDYIDELPVQFIQFTIPASHAWVGKEIHELTLPPNSLLILLIRGKERIVPNGKTKLQSLDTLILSGMSSYKMNQMQLYEKELEQGSDLIEKTISDLSQMEELVILIRRGEEILIPNGNTVLLEKDILVLSSEKLLLD
jgi:cell volume regulation protein A